MAGLCGPLRVLKIHRAAPHADCDLCKTHHVMLHRVSKDGWSFLAEILQGQPAWYLSSGKRKFLPDT